MEFTEDFIKEQGLTPEQVKAISGHASKYIQDREADIKNEYSSLANTNAEKIIQGAIDSAQSKMGITVQRNEGEKFADYLGRATPLFIDSALAKEKESLIKLQNKYNETIENGKFDQELKNELDSAKNKVSELLKKEASFEDTIKSMVPKNDYEAKLNELTQLKEAQAFNSVKPKFADGVNEYESDYKWKKAVAEIKSKYNIEIIDGEAVYKEIDNEFKTGKLKDLIEANKEISELKLGRQVKGVKSHEPNIKLEDVPFLIPENATPEQITKMITDYLKVERGLDKLDDRYSAEFSKINLAIRKQKKA